MPEAREETKPSALQGSAAKRLAPLFIVIIVLLVFCALPLFGRLTISSYKTGKLYAALPISAHETFSVRFTHSVNLSYVTDNLEWTGTTLLLHSTLFTAYGAGMPLPEEIGGTQFAQTPDGFLISGIEREEPRLLIMLQQVPDHHLLYRNREISLLGLAGSGSIITIQAVRASIFEIIFNSYDIDIH